MKTKILIVILLTGLLTSIRPNPIDATPVFVFSELAFETNSGWKLELNVPYTNYIDKVDSIIIKTSEKSAKLKITLSPDKSFYLVSQDSLYSQLSFNPSGDTITIVTYSHPYLPANPVIRTDKTVFGSCPGSTVSAPRPGWSVCKDRLNSGGPYTYLSPKPTLGSKNDPEAVAQKIKGRIYDINGLPVIGLKAPYSDSVYFCLNLPVTLNADGTYSGGILPRLFPPDSMKIDQILVIWAYSSFMYDIQYTEPFYISYFNSDTVLTRDIHLKSSKYAVTSVGRETDIPEGDLTLINYPNPFNSSTNFYVKFPGSMIDKEGIIRIYNSSGELVKTISAKSGKTSIWDGKDMNERSVSSGIYYFQLYIDSRTQKSGSMILLK